MYLRRYAPPPRQRGLGEAATQPSVARARSKDADPVTEMAVVIVALMLVLLILAIAIAVEIARAHRGRGELTRALGVEQSARGGLDSVRTRWETNLEARRYQWDRDVGEVFTTAAQRKVDRVVAAAAGPLTPPSTPPGGGRGEQPRTRRPYYTELTAEQRHMMRIQVAVQATNVRYDITPWTWDDKQLADEFTHRREEVRLLVAELDERRGAHVRQAIVDNTTLVEQAGRIRPAQEAQRTAEDIARQEHRLTLQRERLAEQLEATPRRRALARRELAKQLTGVDGELDELTGPAREARAAAAAAAVKTGVAVGEWDEVLRESAAARQKYRLAEAARRDQGSTSEGEAYLSHLRRDLGMVETEDARREPLSPQQRAASVAKARQRAQQPPTRKPSIGPDPRRGMGPTPYQPPQQDRGHGFER